MEGEIGGGSGRNGLAWPEVVGMSGEEAKSKIEAQFPRLTVVIVPYGSYVTMDYRLNRVRIFVDATGKVAYPPKIG